MKITKQQLKQIIKEEMDELGQFPDEHNDPADSDLDNQVATAINQIRDLVEEADYAARNSPAAKNELVDFIDSLHDVYGSGTPTSY